MRDISSAELQGSEYATDYRYAWVLNMTGFITQEARDKVSVAASSMNFERELFFNLPFLLKQKLTLLYFRCV